MIQILRHTMIVIAACAILATTKATQADRVIGGGGGLSHWGPRPTPLPIRPIQPIHPIRPILPIHPIYPWNPWYGNRIVIAPTYPVPNYYYPPTRWDNGQWDGQTRNVQPQPAPKPPKPPERPRVMEWNAAKGQAEVYDLDRWDKSDSQQASPTPPPAPNSPTDGTEELHRWDK